MINYIIIYTRQNSKEERDFYDFIKYKDENYVIYRFLVNTQLINDFGKLIKVIITETNNTYKVPLDLYYEDFYKS